MATSATTYPKLGGTAWRTLRARAAQAPSSKFIPATVAAIMGHDSPASAAQNVVSPMLKLGLIDENGILTDRGNKWRNDATYAEACQEILDEIYPSEMAGFTTADGSPDKAMVTKWFQHQKFGDSNARQMATTYVMVAEKKVPEAGDKEAKPGRKRQQAPGTAAKAAKPTVKSTSNDAATTPAPPPQGAEQRAALDARAFLVSIDRISAASADEWNPRLRLARLGGQQPRLVVTEVDVERAQRQRLADPQPGQVQHHDQRVVPDASGSAQAARADQRAYLFRRQRLGVERPAFHRARLALDRLRHLSRFQRWFCTTANSLSRVIPGHRLKLTGPTL